MNTSRLLGVLIATAVVVGAGYYKEGLQGIRVDTEAARDQLVATPASVGDWQLKEEQDLDASVVELLNCKGYINRVYVHQQTGAQIHVAVLAGPAGPISVHTPDVCYSSREFRSEGFQKHLEIAGDVSQVFWRMGFRRNDLEAQQLQVVYGWWDGHGWSAPESSRFAFARAPILYKLQLAHVIPNHLSIDDLTVVSDFLREFLPVLNTHLHQL